jgi:ubiquinone/menaquinone biosynthesis C-methylase UbiE
MAKVSKSKPKSVKNSPEQYGYLHGYTEIEQDRLLRQARLHEASLYKNVHFDIPKGKTLRILEPGCGVGAQSRILLSKFSDIHLTLVDRSERQLAKAKGNLSKFKTRTDFYKATGDSLPFDQNTFDGAFICFLLEHVDKPEKILREVLRTLKPGAKIYSTEVFNASFFLEPYAPATLQYLFQFNDDQWNMGGNPFVGAKLGNLLSDCGFQNIETRFLDYHLDRRFPKLKVEHMRDYFELLLSAAPHLLKKGLVKKSLVDEMKTEWETAIADPNSILVYSFVQASAVAL